MSLYDPVGTINDDLRPRVLKKVGSIEHSKLVPPEAETDVCIQDGIRFYNSINPRQFVHEISDASGTKFIILDDVLANWEPRFSNIVKVSRVTNPATNEEIERIYDVSEYYTRKDVDDKDVLHLVYSSSQTLRIEYTMPYFVSPTDPAATTVPNADNTMLTAICSSAVALWVARRASDLAASQLGSHEIHMEELSVRWAERAKELMDEANSYVSPEAGMSNVGLAQQWVAWSELTGKPRISHGLNRQSRWWYGSPKS